MSTEVIDEDRAVLDVEDRFAIAPEWLLDATASDAAMRLYAVLLRFGQTSGARMPARSTLARRMHKKSTYTVDRAMRELVELGCRRGAEPFRRRAAADQQVPGAHLAAAR